MSVKQQRSVIMWESCLITLLLLMGAGFKKGKGTGAKERGRKGKLEENEGEKMTGFITLLGFGPVHVD